MQVLQAGLGLCFFIGVAWLMSSHKTRVDLRVVLAGLAMQGLLAFLIIGTEFGRDRLDDLSQFAAKFLSMAEAGADFVFGPLAGFQHYPKPEPGQDPEAATWYATFPGHLARDEPEKMKDVGIIFAFRPLVTIIFFSAVMAILYYLRIMQVIIWVIAKAMAFLMRVSGAESLAMAANIFVGQTEAPLVVRPYVSKMTQSELMALMTGGFATIAGSVLAVYIGFIGGENAGHLLAASFMSAPAAFMMAKIMVPETEESTTGGKVELNLDRGEAGNVLEAASIGVTDGLRLFLNVLAMLIAFVSLVALMNWPLGSWFDTSIQEIFGWIFSPVAWLMGVEWNDCAKFGSLLGTKIGINEFVAFGQLKSMITDGAMSDRSNTMAAYALCGFANFASIGIQIGGISALAPERRGDLARLAMRAMLGGAFASWMTATIAGAFIS